MIDKIIQTKMLLQIQSKTSAKAFEFIILEINKLELSEQQKVVEANDILFLYENGIKNLNVKQFQNILIFSKKRNTSQYDIESKLAFYEVKKQYRKNILDFLMAYRKTRSLKLNGVDKNGVIKSRRYYRREVCIQFTTFENNIKHGIEHEYYYYELDYSDCNSKFDREQIEYYEWYKVQQKKYIHGKLISKLEFQKGENANYLNYFKQSNLKGNVYTKMQDFFEEYNGFNLSNKNNILNIELNYLIESFPSDYDYNRLILSKQYINGKLNGFSRIFLVDADFFNYYDSEELYDLEDEIIIKATLLEHHYQNNKLQGKQICYYGYENLEYNGPVSNQKMYELNFDNGLLDGKQFFYFGSGEIKLELNYFKGKIIDN